MKEILQNLLGAFEYPNDKIKTEAKEGLLRLIKRFGIEADLYVAVIGNHADDKTYIEVYETNKDADIASWHTILDESMKNRDEVLVDLYKVNTGEPPIRTYLEDGNNYLSKIKTTKHETEIK